MSFQCHSIYTLVAKCATNYIPECDISMPLLQHFEGMESLVSVSLCVSFSVDLREHNNRNLFPPYLMLVRTTKIVLMRTLSSR